jgi:hypothetical protein
MKTGVAAGNATTAVFDSSVLAEESIENLCRSGFDRNKLSLVGKDSGRNASVAGCYGGEGGVRCCGHLDSFWTRCWARLSGWAFLLIPEMGPILVAGPLARWIASAIENAAVFGGLSPLAAGLYSLGISRDAVRRCESAVDAGAFLLVVHGTAEEVEAARTILSTRQAGAG